MPCVHLVQGHGCGIYDTRPQSCRDYACAWLLATEGDGPSWWTKGTRMRPERCGVIVDVLDDDGKPGVAVARELRPGALRKPAGKRLLMAGAVPLPAPRR